VTTRLLSPPTTLVWLTLLTVAAGVLARLYDLDRMVVWHDEVFTVSRVFGYEQRPRTRFVFSGHLLAPAELMAYQRPAPDRGWKATLSALVEHPEHAPLYYLAARLATSVTPDPLLAVRGTSAVLSLLLIPALFWLARELFGDNQTPWIAAGLVACSPMQLIYAQEARQYALWACVAAAASAAFLKASRRRRTADWGLYAGLVVLGLYSHLLFAVVVAAHGTYGLLLSRSDGRPIGQFLRPWATAVGVGVLVFLPWVWVIVRGAERVSQYTRWMAISIPLSRSLENWGLSLVRVFVDFPSAGALLLIGLLPLAWILWWFARTAPPRAVLFLAFLLGFLAMPVALPDMVFGGSRSMHPRYLLPGFLAIDLAVAYVLAAAWESTSAGNRLRHAPSRLRFPLARDTTQARSGSRVAPAGLVLCLALGLGSDLLILRADTWWSKNYSSQNRAIAHVVNAADRPLVLASDTGVALGELISLAYYLKKGVRIWGEPAPGQPPPLQGYTDVFALTPSRELRDRLASSYQLVPLLGSWQWYRAVPLSAPGKAGSTPRSP
jgi:uncharacterized membrane protein